MRHLSTKYDELLARRRRLRRLHRDPGDERHDGAHVGAAVRPGAHDQPRRAEDRVAAGGVARRGDRARALARPLHLRHALQHAALRQQRPAHGAEARDRPRGDGADQLLQGYGTVGNDFPISKAYPYFPADIEQRAYDPEEAKSLLPEVRPFRPDRAADLRGRLPRRGRRGRALPAAGGEGRHPASR